MQSSAGPQEGPKIVYIFWINLLENKEMVFKNIQAKGYNGVRTIIEQGLLPFLSKKSAL